MTSLKLTLIVKLKRMGRELKSSCQRFKADIRLAFRKALKDALKAILMGIGICIAIALLLIIFGLAFMPFLLGELMGYFPENPQSYKEVLFSWPFFIGALWVGFCILIFRQYILITENENKQ